MEWSRPLPSAGEAVGGRASKREERWKGGSLVFFWRCGFAEEALRGERGTECCLEWEEAASTLGGSTTGVWVWLGVSVITPNCFWLAMFFFGGGGGGRKRRKIKSGRRWVMFQPALFGLFVYSGFGGPAYPLFFFV